MKTILLLSLFIFSTAYGATCTTTSRTNYSVGQVLTSSSLNADLNQLVTKVNGLDGGCVTDGSLEAAALNSTDFAAVTNGIHQGCAVSYSDANTVSVDKCILSVNGNFVKTATASTVTWGCTSCASEVVSTQYYVYAKTGSTGTTLNLLISTTAPNGDGYDSSSNKILGKFYNNASGNIVAYTAESWNTNRFVNNAKKIFTFSYGTGVLSTVCSTGSCLVGQDESYVSGMTWNTTGAYTVTFNQTFSSIKCIANVTLASLLPAFPGSFSLIGSTTNTLTFGTYSSISPYAQSDTYGTIHCEGY